MRLTPIHTVAYPHDHPHVETSAAADGLWAGLFWSFLLLIGMVACLALTSLFTRGRKDGSPLPYR